MSFQTELTELNNMQSECKEKRVHKLPGKWKAVQKREHFACADDAVYAGSRWLSYKKRS